MINSLLTLTDPADTRGVIEVISAARRMNKSRRASQRVKYYCFFFRRQIITHTEGICLELLHRVNITDIDEEAITAFEGITREREREKESSHVSLFDRASDVSARRKIPPDQWWVPPCHRILRQCPVKPFH